MKKMFLFALMCLISISSFAIETTKCVLQHNGVAKIYDASAIATALANAVDGDILFLSEGNYDGFTLDKIVYVKGVGEKTIINSINVNIPNNPSLEKVLIEDVKVWEVYLESEMSGFCMKHAIVTNFIINKLNNNILIEQCQIATIEQSRHINNMSVRNSKIFDIETITSEVRYGVTQYVYTGKPMGTCTYTNCNIRNLKNYDSGKSVNGIFVNCIIGGTSTWYNGHDIIGDCHFVNSLFKSEINHDESCVIQQCYYDSNLAFDLYDCNFENSELLSKGYLGDEGTIVGVYGGSNPFTLDPSIPKVTSSSISLDKANKMLNVSIKVTAK